MNASHYAKAKQAYYQKHGGTNKTQQATLSSPNGVITIRYACNGKHA